MGLGSATPNFNTVSYIWKNICIIQIKQCTFSNVLLRKYCLALYIIPIPLEILFFYIRIMFNPV